MAAAITATAVAQIALAWVATSSSYSYSIARVLHHHPSANSVVIAMELVRRGIATVVVVVAALRTCF